MPGLRALAEFAHPALALTGFGFWAGYVLTGDRVFAVIGLGVLVGTICAGPSWFTASTRAARRVGRGALARRFRRGCSSCTAPARPSPCC
jgi:hypothetical protein